MAIVFLAILLATDAMRVLKKTFISCSFTNIAFLTLSPNIFVMDGVKRGWSEKWKTQWKNNQHKFGLSLVGKL